MKVLTLTDDDRNVVARALALAAAESRTARAQARTSELFSIASQKRERVDLDALARQQDRLAATFNDDRVSVQIVDPRNKPRPSRRTTGG